MQTPDLIALWRRGHLLFWPLAPLSLLFCLWVSLRRACYRWRWCKTYRSQVPVVVVGNLCVGGTGKTPLVICLSQLLQQWGYRVGIVSRGYHSSIQTFPYHVQPSDSAQAVGDEPLLLARTGCPVVLAPQRILAVQELEKFCDVIISDDGLQHYTMGRDIELLLLDEHHDSQYFCLPAGSLRESKRRVQSVDFVLSRHHARANVHHFAYHSTTLINLKTQQHRALVQFPLQKIHALAGVGNPFVFFETLQRQGFDVITHVFPDHFFYKISDLQFNDGLPIIMTEKDAVKCQAFADERMWCLPIQVELSDEFISPFKAQLSKRLSVGCPAVQSLHS
jgi:tetraacyldisaccharide 4'-kinase